MAIITMRELLRAPSEAFERIDEGEACLVTRHGKPVAALVPVDQADAEKFLIAAAPELARDRQEAEHARAEGKTTPLEEVAQRFGVEQPEADEESDNGSEELIQEAVAEAQAALPAVAVEVLSYYPSHQDREAAVARLVELQGHLVRGLVEAAPAHVAADVTMAPAGETIDWALEQVASFNQDVVEIRREFGPSPPSAFEAYLMGAIGAVERVRVPPDRESDDAASLMQRVLGFRR
jgi:antitoxin (DNA-binding transcriptional repressor) of toxin-antitoxin stability system